MTEDPFEALQDGDSPIAAVMNYVHLRLGDEGLRELLARLVHPDEELLAELGTAFRGADRKELARSAADLMEMGLDRAADIVLEVAAQVPEPKSPFDPETDRADHRVWLKRHHDNGGYVAPDQQWWVK
jgi:hypothetical protein